MPSPGVFQKADTAKPRLELIEPAFIMELGAVLTFGAEKYSANNWKNATAEDIERIKGAMLRHQMAYLDGEKIDPESGLSHLSHISCNAMFLQYFDNRRGHTVPSMGYGELEPTAECDCAADEACSSCH